MNNIVGDGVFIRNVFSKLEEWQENDILLIDKVFFIIILTFHGGMLPSSSGNKPEHLANTVLSFMVVCLFGVSELFLKVLPVYKQTCKLMIKLKMQVAIW